MRLVADARQHLPRSAPLIAGIWMDAIEALALAQVRDRNALTKLDQAEARLTQAADEEPVWPWIFRFDERKLAGFRAQVAGKLGRHGIAAKAMRLAHDPQQAPKPRAVMDVLHADVLARSGNVDEACAVAVRAFAGRATAELDERLYGTYREEH